MVAVIVAVMTSLWYLAAFLAHTIGPEKWRWLSEVDKVRLTGEVRGFGWGLVGVALLGTRAFWAKVWRKLKDKDKDEDE